LVLTMPENMSLERRNLLRAYGAELVLTPEAEAMEGAVARARALCERPGHVMLDQFANDDNWMAHYETTGPEIWEQTRGEITHFVSAMGTTGTITGVSRYLKERKAAVEVVGAQPTEGSSIPGIRRWPPEYLPGIYRHAIVDRIESVSQADAEETARRLAVEEGIFGGVSSGGACAIALRVAAQLENATVVFVVCDRGDRYLSTGVFAA
ncbi:MAG: pyridoxal-phosphate dependent enzyme, partial [Gammaproteobacteria bacterium]